MKRFYILFAAGGILSILLMAWSTRWFLAEIGALMILIACRYFISRVRMLQSTNATLEQLVEDLHTELEIAVRKEERISRAAEESKLVEQDLLASMSHDIRTPMNGILGMTALLFETPLNPEQEEYLRTISRSGETLLVSVNDVLASSMLRLTKSGFPDEKANTPFGLRDCIEDVLDSFSGKTGQNGPDLLYDIDNRIPETIIAESKRLRTVLTHLVDNAVKWTTKGEITICARISDAENNNKNELLFEIRDTGSGFEAGKIEQAFTGLAGPGFAEIGENEPAGLGLIICKKLTAAMGGWINLESQPGAGSIFTFGIPVSPAQSPSHVQPRVSVLEGKRILVVDKAGARRANMVRRLEQCGLIPVPLEDRMEATQMLIASPEFHLVLIDEHWAVTMRTSLAETIKDCHPGLPVILLREPGNENMQPQPGIFDAVLTSPIRQHTLKDGLINLLLISEKDSLRQTSTPDVLPVDLSTIHPLRILVAEDNEINQKIAMKVLGKLGYQPGLAVNGKEVLEMVGEQPYDLILMDVQMPEMDGLKATQMIRLCLETQPVIVAMTANVMQGDRDSCLQAGMDDYISKPLEVSELVAQLMKWGAYVTDKRKTTGDHTR